MQLKNKKITGNISLHGDKSIAHRAIIVASHFPGIHLIKNLPQSNDLIATLTIFKQYGLKYKMNKNNIKIDSRNVSLIKQKINCNESGTTARLITGYLSGANIETIVSAKKSLLKRPMSRIISPLDSFGVNIKGLNKKLPIQILPSKKIDNCNYSINIPSAQIKASLILYSLHIKGENVIKGKIQTRDHLEILLKDLGYPIKYEQKKVIINGKGKINKNIDMTIPGDVSSASFIIAAAILIKESDITIKNICINPFRMGFIRAVEKMGANIKLINKKILNGEKVADINIKYSNNLIGIKIHKKDVPSLIDEIPILSFIANYASSRTLIEGVEELEVKESNRIESIIQNIKKMGGNISYNNNTLKIEPKKLYSTPINSYGDHRIYMTFYIANMVLDGLDKYNSKDKVYEKSFPNFINIMEKIFV